LVDNQDLIQAWWFHNIPQQYCKSEQQLATPASIDSIVSSNGQEDHVSMGANAATKALRVLDNLEQFLP
jgi:histidine ammonia-lyase